MRLLFISRDEFPPTRPDVEVLFSRELASRGMLIDWILVPSAINPKATSVEWRGGKVWLSANQKAHNAFDKFSNRVRGWANEIRAIQLISQNKYDILQIKDRFLSCAIAWILKRLYKKKFVFTYWLSYPYHEEYRDRAHTASPFSKLMLLLRATFTEAIIKHWIIPLADHIFVQSDVMADDFIRLGAKKAQITAVPMGVDPDKIPELPPSSLKPEVIYLGTLSRVRKLDFLIRTFATVLKSRPDAKLKFIGKGELDGDVESLQVLTRDLKIEHSVEFIGQIPQQEAWAQMAEASVCVSPFYPSPTLVCASPTKLVEYMALGKASVANNIPEQKSLLEKSHAGICVDWNEQNFAAAIVTLLNDPDRCTRMGVAGRQYVLQNRTYPILAESVKKAYDDLMVAT